MLQEIFGGNPISVISLASFKGENGLRSMKSEPRGGEANGIEMREYLQQRPPDFITSDAVDGR